MLRDKNLIPLSHQHQHALALCVRIDRASPIPAHDFDAWQAEIAQLWQNEIALHFAAEEQVLFPAARRFNELAALVQELVADHARLRDLFSRATEQRLSAADVSGLAHELSAHIRKEERQLFERLQALVSPEEMNALGRQLEKGLKDAVQVCALPKPATALRSKK